MCELFQKNQKWRMMAFKGSYEKKHQRKSIADRGSGGETEPEGDRG